jgi:hypothetical protein
MFREARQTMDRTSAHKWLVWRSALILAVVAAMTAGCHGDDDGEDPITQEEALELIAIATDIMDEAVAAVNEDPSLRRVRGVAAAMVAVKQSGVTVSGRTFVLDASRLPSLVYVNDPARTGVATDRTRFVLYDVDAQFVPVQPLVESGFLEIGNSSPTAVYLQGGSAGTYSGTGTLSLAEPWDFARQTAAVLAGRTLTFNGTLSQSSPAVPFSYTDTIGITGPGGDFIDDRRNIEVTTASGFMSFEARTQSSVRFSDSDHDVEISFEIDSHDVVVAAGWIRGNGPGVTSISIDGDETLLTVDMGASCNGGTCYRFRNQPLASATLEAFDDALWALEGRWSDSGYMPTGPLEALAAPVLFGVAQSRITELVARTVALINASTTLVNDNPVLSKIQGVAPAIVRLKQSVTPTAGMTFVLDPTRLPSLVYIADGSRPPVTSNYVRFMLYEVAPTNPGSTFSSVQQPLVESGYFDIGTVPDSSGRIGVYLEGAPYVSYLGGGNLDTAAWNVARSGSPVLLARQVSAEGFLPAGPGRSNVPFTYADSVTGQQNPQFVSDSRTLTFTQPSGNLWVRASVGTSISPSDSDNTLRTRATIASHHIELLSLGIRGYVPPPSFSINGDLTVVEYSSGCNCYLLNEQPLDASLSQSLLAATNQLSTWPVGYGSLYTAKLEAIAVPLLFSLAQPL